MNRITKLSWDVIAGELPSGSDIEALRKMVLLSIMFLFGAICLLIFVFVAYAKEDILLAAVDATVLAFLIALFVYLRKSGNFRRTGALATTVACLFFTFQIAHGGINQTVIIWSLTYPLISLFLLGPRRGVLMSLLLLALAIAIFVLGKEVSWLTVYQPDLIFRFIVAYLIIFLFSFTMEKVRDAVHARVEASNRDLQEALHEIQETAAALAGSNRELRAEIAERRRAEVALRESEEKAKRAADVNRTMAELGRIIGSTLSIEEVYEQFSATVRQIIPFDRAMIGLINEEEGTWTRAYSWGVLIEDQRVGDVHPLTGFVQDVFRKKSGDILYLKDEKELAENYPLLLSSFRAGFRSMMAAPLISKDRVVGVLHFSSFRPAAYTAGDAALAENVARQIAGAVVNTLIHTQVRRAEEALRESEEKYRGLFEAESDALLVIDKETGAILDVNPAACRLYGYSREEMLAIRNTDLSAEPEETVQSTREFRKRIPLRVHRKKDGTEFPVDISASLIGYRGRDFIQAAVRDITERKRAEEEREKLQTQLTQSQKMESVGRLAGGVAHDFNNMLGIIIGNAEMSALRVSPDDPIYQDLQEILKASHRSADIVRQLLAFARKQTISPKILDLNETVSRILNMLRRLIGEDIDLAWLPGHGLRPVKADPSQVDQILANLVVNARDAISGAGKVTIETADIFLDESYCQGHPGCLPGEYTLLAVSDTGIGMSREVMEHLFDPFFTTKEVGRGTGLGLATVYGIVKQNSGFIDVHSEPGQGTTFKIYFPTCEGDSAVLHEKTEGTLPEGTETILIAEDEIPLMNIARDILVKQGYKVLAARTPTEALSLAGNHAAEIHMLLTDVVMPEMNGRRLAELLRSGRPGLKCLFMSGYTADVVAHHGVLDEGVHFIEKPFSPRTLAGKVREMLDGP